MKRVVGVNIVVSLILIFFLKSSAESEKAWLELYSEKYDNNPVADIIKDHNKDLYLATSSKFYKINDNNTLKEIEIDNKYINKRILKIYPSRKKSIYVLFEAGSRKCIITEYINSGWKELGELELNYNSFFEDSKYRLWSMDYSFNVLLFKGNTWKTIKYNSGLLKSDFEHLGYEYLNFLECSYKDAVEKKFFNPLIFLEDSKGRIWIYSSVINGENYYISMTEILCYHNDKINTFPLTDLPKKLISFIVEVKPNILWIWTRGGGIRIFKIKDKGKLKLISSPHSINNSKKELLLGSYKDSKGRIWFVTREINPQDFMLLNPYHSLWRLENDKIKKVKYGIDEVHSGRPDKYCFYEDSKGNIFIGTSKGTLLIRNNRIKEINRLNGLKIPWVKSIISDKNGNIFFLSSNQQCKINSIQILTYEWINKTDRIDRIKAWRIICIKGNIKKDSKGNLWWLSVDINNVESLVKYDGKKKMKTVANMSNVLEKIRKKYNSGFEISTFTIDSKDRLWFYIYSPFEEYVFIYNGKKFEEELNIRKAYENIILNEDENFKLETEDLYSYPIVTKDRKIFYASYIEGNRIAYFNGKGWVDSIPREDFKLDYPIFINSEGYVVVNNSGKEESYIFKDGKWEKSQKYFYKPDPYKLNKWIQDPPIDYKDSKGNKFIYSRYDGLRYMDPNNNLYKIDDFLYPFCRTDTVVKIFEDIKGNIWFKYWRDSNSGNTELAVLDISKLKKLIEKSIIRIGPVIVEHEVIPLQAQTVKEIDKTQKLEELFNKLKSNDDKINKEAMEEFINLKVISKEYLIKKLNETSDETLKWRINAILSRIE